MWNSILAGIVFQHETIEKLRRELARNGQLREIYGFFNQVPPAWVYTRFLKNILKHTEEVDKIFEKLVKQMRELLPDFGKHLAVDSKAIPSFARRKNGNQTTDGRRDTDANYGKKEYRGQNKDGSLWEKMVKWFGYKLHLVGDTTYELPVAYKVTKASGLKTLEKGTPYLNRWKRSSRRFCG